MEYKSYNLVFEKKKKQNIIYSGGFIMIIMIFISFFFFFLMRIRFYTAQYEPGVYTNIILRRKKIKKEPANVSAIFSFCFRKQTSNKYPPSRIHPAFFFFSFQFNRTQIIRRRRRRRKYYIGLYASVWSKTHRQFRIIIETP